MELTRSLLVSAAAELNGKLGIDPPIDTELSTSQLEKLVKEAAIELVTPTDSLSKETRKLCDFFRNGDGKKEAGEAEPKKEKGKKDKPNDEAKAEKAAKPIKAKKDAAPVAAKEGKEDDAKPADAKALRKPAKRAEGPTLADFMDDLLANESNPEKLVEKFAAEVKRRGVSTSPTLSTLRAHLKHRQGQGKLQNVKISTPTAAA